VKNIEKFWFKLLGCGVILILFYKLADNFYDIKIAAVNFMSLLTPFFVGVLIAFFVYKPSHKIEELCKKSGIKFIKKPARSIGIFSVYIIIVGLFIICGQFFIPLLSQNIAELSRQLPAYYSELSKMLGNIGFIDSAVISTYLINGLQNIFNLNSVNAYWQAITGFANSVFNLFTGIVISVYILFERESLTRILKAVFQKCIKKEWYGTIQRFLGRFVVLFYAYFTGLALDALIIAVVTAPFLYLLKIPYPLVFAVVIFICNMIPFFGPIVATVLIYIVSALAIGPVQALWVLLIQVVLGQIDGNFIQPKIVGETVGISPFWVVFAVIVFGGLWKFTGMILGVPLVAAVRMVCINYFE
jgi:predicted PurR-regulated permease PerM